MQSQYDTGHLRLPLANQFLTCFAWPKCPHSRQHAAKPLTGKWHKVQRNFELVSLKSAEVDDVITNADFSLVASKTASVASEGDASWWLADRAMSWKSLRMSFVLIMAGSLTIKDENTKFFGWGSEKLEDFRTHNLWVGRPQKNNCSA